MAANVLNAIKILDIFKEYEDVFNGKLGNLPNIYNIRLKENAQPKIASPRPIPASLRGRVKNQQIIKAEIIEEVTEPTDWVHPIVIVQNLN